MEFQTRKQILPELSWVMYVDTLTVYVCLMHMELNLNREMFDCKTVAKGVDEEIQRGLS